MKFSVSNFDANLVEH